MFLPIKGAMSLLLLLLLASACSDPMPMYASYKPASNEASGRIWFPASPQPRSPEAVEGAPKPRSSAHPASHHKHDTANTEVPKPEASSAPPKLASPRAKPPTPTLKQEDTGKQEDARIDLNHATQAELETLPGVGPATAKKIIAYRERRPFKRTAQLQNVRGIGSKTYRKLAPLVTVDEPE